MNLKRMFNLARKGVSKRSPEFLTAVSILGFFTAIGLAVKATPKALDLITAAEDQKEDELTALETVKAAYKPYVPAIVTAAVSTACAVGSTHISRVRTTELATAYALSQAYIKHYEDKTEDAVGEEKATEIKNAVMKETVKDSRVRKSMGKLPPQTLETNPNGDLHPYWDPLSNTPFYASKEILERTEVALNRRLYCDLESYVTVADYYDELNANGAYPKLKHTAVSPMLGWRADSGGVKFYYGDFGEWDDGTPCRIATFASHYAPDHV